MIRLILTALALFWLGVFSMLELAFFGTHYLFGGAVVLGVLVAIGSLAKINDKRGRQ